MLKSHEVWLAANGPAPWPCAFCEKPVARLGSEERAQRSDSGIVHHHDGNHDNNEPSNLRAAHNGCHVAHHRSMITWPYQELAATLRAKIESGELAGCLPSRMAMSKELGVAPKTVDSAIEQLREEGLVVSRRGLGTFVTK